MSHTENTPIFTFDNNDQYYDDLIGYGAIRKQFSRIIPSYYTEIDNHSHRKPNHKASESSIEEYKRLKEEIKAMKSSIELLKESKQQKLKQIEDLRVIMRKVGSKLYTNINKDKKQIHNNYCCREKPCTQQNTKYMVKENCGMKNSEEGLSLTPATSDLSSGKDEDAGAEDKGCQDPYFNNSRNSNSSSGSWCFREEEMPKDGVMRNNPEEKKTLLINN